MRSKYYTQHEHLNGFGIINMNGRIYDPTSASFFSPDPFVVDATSTQSFNRYSYCLNNPLMYTDPSGEFIFGLLGIIGDCLNNLSNSISSLFEGRGHKGTWNAAETGGEIDKGGFRGDLKQIISRFTVELPQSLLGYVINGMAAVNGQVKEVTNLDGATVAETYRGDGGAFTLGSFIYGEKGIRAEVGNDLFMHEYGHYIQSQYYGPIYLLNIGIPSLFSAAFSKEIDEPPYTTHRKFGAEKDANRRASGYFNSRYGTNWNYDIYPINEEGERWNNVGKPKGGIRR